MLVGITGYRLSGRACSRGNLRRSFPRNAFFLFSNTLPETHHTGLVSSEGTSPTPPYQKCLRCSVTAFGLDPSQHCGSSELKILIPPEFGSNTKPPTIKFLLELHLMTSGYTPSAEDMSVIRFYAFPLGIFSHLRCVLTSLRSSSSISRSLRYFQWIRTRMRSHQKI
jgi:hypothetical protein